MTADEDGDRVVTVLQISHTPPGDPALAVEIPAPVKRRLRLDDEPNRFIWPGPDLRPTTPQDSASIGYEPLPFALFDEIRIKFIAAIKARRASVVPRTE